MNSECDRQANAEHEARLEFEMQLRDIYATHEHNAKRNQRVYWVMMLIPILALVIPVILSILLGHPQSR